MTIFELYLLTLRVTRQNYAIRPNERDLHCHAF